MPDWNPVNLREASNDRRVEWILKSDPSVSSDDLKLIDETSTINLERMLGIRMPNEEHAHDYHSIAKYFLAHPEKDHKTAATELADLRIISSSSTALRRIVEMKQEAILVERTDINDWRAVGYPFRYRIDVYVDQNALREPGESKSYGAPAGETPHERVDNWRSMARYIMKNLLSFLEGIEASKTVSGKKFSRDNLIVQNVTILLGQQADLTVTIRARTQEAVLSFVVDGLRAMRGVKMTNTSHEAWSVNEGEL